MRCTFDSIWKLILESSLRVYSIHFHECTISSPNCHVESNYGHAILAQKHDTMQHKKNEQRYAFADSKA